MRLSHKIALVGVDGDQSRHACYGTISNAISSKITYAVSTIKVLLSMRYPIRWFRASVAVPLSH